MDVGAENSQNKRDICSTDFAGIRVDFPYPEVKVLEPNRRYALAMLDNFGGEISEMSAVSLYLYDNLTLFRDYPGAASIFLQIGEVEMRHLKIFGQLATELGCDTRLWTQNTGAGMRYWSPLYNSYACSLSDIISIAIESEREAVKKYRAQAAVIRDENIITILDRIILDEENHIRLFEMMRDKCLR